MSPLLFREMRVHNPDLADLIGLHEAILVQQIHYRCVTSKRADGEEFCWWVVAMDAIAREIHVSTPSARRVVKGLEDQDLIVVRQVGSNRTQHYRVNYRTLYRMQPPDLESDEGIAYFEASISTLASDQNDLLKRSNWALEAIRLSASHARDLLADNKKENKSTQKERAREETSRSVETDYSLSDAWDRFLKVYPQRRNEQGQSIDRCVAKGLQCFTRLVKGGTSPEALVTAAANYARTCRPDGLYVKQIPTFLNGSWNEFTQAAPTARQTNGADLDEKQLAKARAEAQRKADLFKCDIGRIDKRFANG